MAVTSMRQSSILTSRKYVRMSCVTSPYFASYLVVAGGGGAAIGGGGGGGCIETTGTLASGTFSIIVQQVA